MYGLGLFNKNYKVFKYDIARLASEPNMSAKFEGLVLFGTRVESKKNFGTYRGIGIFYLTPFPCTNLQDFLVSGVI